MTVRAHLFRILLPFPIEFRLLRHCCGSGTGIAPCINGTRFFTDLVEKEEEEEVSRAETPEEVLRKWGCNDSEVTKIFQRHPALRNATATKLESKLSVLRKLGLTSVDLVRMIHIRPRIMSCQFNQKFEERVDHLKALFGSRELLVKAIVRNPTLLAYNFHDRVEPVFGLYEGMGVSRRDLISMLLIRSSLIRRTKMCEKKLEYIRRSGATKESKMYKYLVTIMGISRIDTICEKIANLERFGIPEDQVLQLFGRCPVLMTLSVDKIQRNTTFVVGAMKLPASIVAAHPFLLIVSLENVLKPRVLLGGKIQDMGLEPQMRGSRMMTALRMPEVKFVEAFIGCHEKDVREELLAYYRACQGIKRLALSSKKNQHIGAFPF